MNLNNNIEFKKALNIIWMFTAFLFLLILLALIFFSENELLNKVPVCESKKLGLQCFLCGTSRAFIEIKKFNFQQEK